MNWINRKDREPDGKQKDLNIIAWYIDGPIVLSYYLLAWRNNVDGLDVPFEYWMEAPGEPVNEPEFCFISGPDSYLERLWLHHYD